MTKWADQIYFKSAIEQSKVGGIGILYNDNSVPQSIYLGYGNTPWNNGLKIDNDITFKNQKIYHEGNKPTPDEIGAKAKEPTKFYMNKHYVGVRTSVRTADQYYEFWDDGAGWADIKCKNVYAGDGKYQVYHQGFKPTSSEIGAVNKSGDTMTGDLFFNASQCGKPIGVFMDSANNMNRGLEYYDKSRNFMGGFGATANQDRIQKIYMGITRTPWDGNKTLTVDGDGAYFDNQKIYHKGNKPTPEEIGAGGEGLCLDARKKFEVGGEANKYYPVVIKVGELNAIGVYGLTKVSISRGYASKAPDSWNNSTHKGGLTLTLLTSGDCYWGGNDQYIEVLRFDQTYSTMVAGMQLSTSGIVVWLRGGGATYYLTSDYGTASTVDIKMEGFTDSANQVFGIRTDDKLVDSEIRSRYRLRYNGLFDGNSKVYSPNNKPTANDIGAWSKMATRLEGVNFNTITQGGCYATVRNSTSNNAPVNQDGRLLVLSWNSKDWASQMFFADGGRIYTRTATNITGTAWTGWTELYTRQSKPISSEIGAVNKSGDTIAGTLKFSTVGNEIEIMNPSQGFQARGMVFKDNFNNNNLIGMVGAHFNGQSMHNIFIGTTPTPWDGNKSFMVDNQYCYYDHKKIYHEGFRPTANDIGAVSKSGDTINGNLTIANNGVLNAGNISLRGRDFVINGKRALVGYAQNDGNLLVINFDKDFGAGVSIKGNVIMEGEKITSNGQIYVNGNDIVVDRNLIFGSKAISTLQSGESNLFAEGRQSAHGYGWHFANLNGQYSDIYAKIYHQQSDARTKEEVEKNLSLLKRNETVLEKISKVTPKEFYYSEDISKKTLYGFFAQEIEKEFPLAVNTANYSQKDIESGDIIFPKDKNGQDIYDLKSIDPVAISAIMWDALKEIYNSLEMQKIKNKELLDRIKLLEKKIK